MKQAIIDEIRAFNRWYTGIIGLLDRHLLNSSFSLPEARVLYELYHRDGIQAGEITALLGLDKGYLSSMLDQFVKKALRKAVRQRVKKLGMKYDNEASFFIIIIHKIFFIRDYNIEN